MTPMMMSIMIHDSSYVFNYYAMLIYYHYWHSHYY